MQSAERKWWGMVDLDSVKRDAMIFRTLELGRSSYLPPLGCSRVADVRRVSGSRESNRLGSKEKPCAYGDQGLSLLGSGGLGGSGGGGRPNLCTAFYIGVRQLEYAIGIERVSKRTLSEGGERWLLALQEGQHIRLRREARAKGRSGEGQHDADEETGEHVERQTFKMRPLGPEPLMTVWAFLMPLFATSMATAGESTGSYLCTAKRLECINVINSFTTTLSRGRWVPVGFFQVGLCGNAAASAKPGKAAADCKKGGVNGRVAESGANWEVNGTGKCGTAKASYSRLPDVEARDRSVGRLHPSNLVRMCVEAIFCPPTDEFHAEQRKAKKKQKNKRNRKCKSETIRALFFISSCHDHCWLDHLEVRCHFCLQLFV